MSAAGLDDQIEQLRRISSGLGRSRFLLEGLSAALLGSHVVAAERCPLRETLDAIASAEAAHGRLMRAALDARRALERPAPAERCECGACDGWPHEGSGVES